MKKIILILSLLMLQSCGSSKPLKSENDIYKIINSWKGSTKNSLLRSWGAPTSKSSDGNGGEILTFRDLKRGYIQGRGYITVVHITSFYVNSENVIYDGLYQKEAREGY